MIAKAASIAHTANALNYAGGKDKAEFLASNRLAGTSPEEIRREFAEEQVLNGRCIKNTVAIILSPTIEDGKAMDNGTFKSFAEDFMERMGFEKHQWAAFLRNDREHKHMHIYANRIGPDGRAYKDNFIQSKAIDTATGLAQEYGLRSAKLEAKQAVTQKEGLRRDIFDIHNEVMRFHPQSLARYKGMMGTAGVKVTEVQASLNGAKQTQGLRYEVNGQSFKASRIDRSMSFANLRKELERNRTEIRSSYGSPPGEQARRSIFEAHTQVMKRRPMSLDTYIQEMQKQGVRTTKVEYFRDGKKKLEALRMESGRHSLRSYEADRSMELDLITEDLKRTPPQSIPQEKSEGWNAAMKEKELPPVFTRTPTPERDYFKPTSAQTVKPVSLPVIDAGLGSPAFTPSKRSLFDSVPSFGGGGGSHGSEEDEEDQPQKKSKSRDAGMGM